MTACFYLIRKGDLYKINHSKNIDKELKQLKPDDVIFKMDINSPEIVKARLYRRYKYARLPGTDYFKLTDKQLRECKIRLNSSNQLNQGIGQEFVITSTASFFLFVVSYITCAQLHFGIVKTIAASLFLPSIAFWMLFVFGSFGGYETHDLPIFSSWGNRLKALLFALIISTLSFSLFSLL